jgi:Ca2+-binding RTX toxin-like protein
MSQLSSSPAWRGLRDDLESGWRAAAVRIAPAGNGDDYLVGTEGDDYLFAGNGNDTIDGLGGNDTIEGAGGLGDDTYLFGYGSDHDLVLRGHPLVSEINVLQLQAGVAASDLVLTREWRGYVDDNGQWQAGYVDLRVTLDSGESILFQDFSRNDDPFANGNPLAVVRFDNGNTWDLAAICAAAGQGTAEADELIGFGFLAETLRGYAGNDTLVGNAGDTLLGGDGDDTLGGEAARLEGGAGRDQLQGTGEAVLLGGSGDDTLSGGASLSGGGGHDRLTGDAATLDGGEGNDLLNGTERSTLVGGAGHDQLNAISGGSAAQHARLQGGLGDDSLQGALHTDVVFALGDGRDRYRGWDNADGSATAADRAQLHLGAGFSAGALGLVLDGHDLRLDFGTGDTLTLADYFADTGATKRGADAQISVGLMHFAGDGSTHDLREWITGGSNSADTLTGSAGNDLVAGHLGNDRLDGGQGHDGLHGGVGDDSLIGGEGHDTLVGALGRDTLAGGQGDDVYHLDDSDAAASEAANAGTDAVVYSAIRYMPVTEYTLRDNFEHLTLAEGTAATTGHGNALANRLTGNALDNTLNGNAGADSLLGGLGNDSLDGGTGADSAQGGQGDDVFFTDDALDLTIELLGEGIDTVWASVNWQLAANVENLQLDGAAVKGAGNALNNQLTGNDLANTLQGLDGADTIDGGLGNDRLEGGKGADTYLFAAGGGKDTVVEKDATLDVRDIVDFGALERAEVRFVHVGNNLEARIIGSTDKLVIKDWYLGDRYEVEDFVFADGTWDGDDLAPVALEASLDAALTAVRRPDLPGDVHLML